MATILTEVYLRQLAELPEANPLPVLLCDGRGRVLYRNPAAEAFPKRFPDEFDRIEQILPEDFKEIVEGLIASGETLTDRLHEVHGRVLSLTYKPLANRKELFVVIVDETERIRAIRQARAYAKDLEEAYQRLRDTQAHLIQSTKMAALGSLVSGIAHELNSPLGALTANNQTEVSCLKRLAASIAESEPSEAAREEQARLLKALEELAAAGRAGLERISELVRNLRGFARLDRASEDDVDLHEGLDSALALLGHELKRGIEVRRAYNLGRLVRCSPGQINQVFMNLLLNAAQAIPGAGVIEVRTCARDRFAVVEIIDDGEGIPEDNLQRIFDPGFTTRGVGVGIGLGLAVAYRVVNDHGGRIEVESAPGKGSTFRVFLPLSPRAAADD